MVTFSRGISIAVLLSAVFTAPISLRAQAPLQLAADSFSKTAWEIGQRRQVPVGWEHVVIGGDLSLEPRKL